MSRDLKLFPVAEAEQRMNSWVLATGVEPLEADWVAIRFELKRLRAVAQNVYEVWAGSEGIPEPKTVVEAYLLQLVEQMRDEAKKGL